MCSHWQKLLNKNVAACGRWQELETERETPGDLLKIDIEKGCSYDVASDKRDARVSLNIVAFR